MFHRLNQHLFGLLTIIPLISFALPEDKIQKVFISSKTCVYNYKKGTSVFEGNVVVDQGTTHITADKLTTKNNSAHQLQETIAYGLNQLAHYWTLPKVGDPEIHANAKIIKFYPIASTIFLEQNVTVRQGANSFHGDAIQYNFNNQIITVPASKRGRAVLVYNPDD